MSTLPKTWAFAPIGEVTLDCSQKVPAADESFHYIDIASVDRNTKSIVNPQALVGKDAPSRARKLVRSGDVLVSMTRPNLNAVALVPENMDGQIASTGFDVLRADGIDPRWLFYLVRSQSFVDRMSELVQGALYPAVRSKDVRGYVAPIAPLNEQKRIADKLDSVLARVDTCRERLDRVPATLKRFRQSVLAAAISGKLTEQWREERGAEEWKTINVLSVASEVFDGPFGSHLKSKDYSRSGVRVVRLENIGWLKFFLDKETFITHKKYKTLRKHTLKAQDVIFSSFISEEIRVCLLPDELSGKAINKADCFCIRTNTDLCLPSFLAIRLASRSTFLTLEQEVHGATRPRINLRQLKEFTFELPPLSEQVEIVRRVNELFAYANSLEAHYTSARAKIENLTPALLAKAFLGELVPQDPNDEPASLLLQRIQQARAEIGAKPKKRTRTDMPTKTKLDSDALKRVIRSLPKDHFTFDELRKKASVDYETLKEIVFALLSEDPASISQIFDTKTKTMHLVRASK